jgi:hypothetical protein
MQSIPYIIKTAQNKANDYVNRKQNYKADCIKELILCFKSEMIDINEFRKEYDLIINQR